MFVSIPIRAVPAISSVRMILHATRTLPARVISSVVKVIPVRVLGTSTAQTNLPVNHRSLVQVIMTAFRVLIVIRLLPVRPTLIVRPGLTSRAVRLLAQQDTNSLRLRLRRGRRRQRRHLHRQRPQVPRRARPYLHRRYRLRPGEIVHQVMTARSCSSVMAGLMIVARLLIATNLFSVRQRRSVAKPMLKTV